MKLRLIALNFLQFAAWGAYLTSMGAYLSRAGLGTDIGNYYAMQGVVALFMPAVMGMIADRWVPAQRLLSLCHFLAAVFMLLAAWTGLRPDFSADADAASLFVYYSLSVVFYMPTLALSNSVAYTALETVQMKAVRVFPFIRTFGTIGFLCTMWAVDLFDMQNNAWQFVLSGVMSLLLAAYALTLPSCPAAGHTRGASWVEMLGLKAFSLFRNRQMAVFFVFSFLLGVSLQITNGYANTYIQSFGEVEAYEHLFFVRHSNLLVSISQVSETLCILLIPFFLHRLGIKWVMFISMVAWMLRFALFGLGDPGTGVWMFILSCVVYGVAFDFFNISGSLYVDYVTPLSQRSSAQGMFLLMSNGLGATVGALLAKEVVNTLVYTDASNPLYADMDGWRISWFIFSAYALVVAVAFVCVFKKTVRL